MTIKTADLKLQWGSPISGGYTDTHTSTVEWVNDFTLKIKMGSTATGSSFKYLVDKGMTNPYSSIPTNGFIIKYYEGCDIATG